MSFTDKPRRYTVGEVELGMIILLMTSIILEICAVYFIKTVSIIVSGRIKHYISALENTIGKEVDVFFKGGKGKI
jgi:hypothetical protein